MDVQADFEEDIGFLRGKVTIHQHTNGNIVDNFRYNFKENNINYYLIFDGLHADPNQCSFESDPHKPIQGEATINFVAETVRHYGTGLMFEPVGLEFLYTDSLKPQVMVKVDGLEGICNNVNCDYAYVNAPSVIYTQAYNSST
jgi:hypothetical protein